MKHLMHGGSVATRDFGCPGWHDVSKDLPKQTSSPAARKGSMHHMVQEHCRNTEDMPEDCVGMVYKEDGHEHEFTEDDLLLSNIAYNATEKILDKYDIDEMEIEPFVQYIPDLSGGSIDLLCLSADGKTLVVVDYKFGRGRVEVKESAQHGVYTISSRADKKTADLWKKVKKIVFVIIQPQLKGTTFLWETTPKFIDNFERRYKIALDSDEVVSGPHCNWCPAAAICSVRRADVVGAIQLGARAKKELQIGADILEEVEDWVASMKAELFTQLTRGTSIKGWKIVEKKASRKWYDPKAAEDELRKAKINPSIFTRTTILTAPQTATAFKKNNIKFDLDELVEIKSSGTTLAPEHDERDAIRAEKIPANLKKLVNA